MREPEGSTTTSSPTRTEPEASWPAYPRYSTCSGERAAPWGRMTTCTGIRNDSCTGSVSGGRVSSSSSSEGPSYQGVFAERSTTLSPTRAETGIAWACGMPSSAAIARTSAATVRKTSSLCSTRSILFTAMTTCGTRIRAATARWRRVCSSTPLRASTSSTRASAVDEPVTVLRVYCTWPGQSASTKERCAVAK